MYALKQTILCGLILGTVNAPLTWAANRQSQAKIEKSELRATQLMWDHVKALEDTLFDLTDTYRGFVQKDPPAHRYPEASKAAFRGYLEGALLNHFMKNTDQVLSYIDEEDKPETGESWVSPTFRKQLRNTVRPKARAAIVKNLNTYYEGEKGAFVQMRGQLVEEQKKNILINVYSTDWPPPKKKSGSKKR